MTGSSVIADLAIWGPHTREAPLSVLDAELYCRTLATSHYENFPVVSWLLPRRLHQHFYNVYAYCRWADDLGDEAGSSSRSLELLDWWSDELARCYAGEATHPVFIALQPTIRRFSIPQAPFADLISAFVQDQTVTHYESMRQLENYCRRSANPVGRIVLSLCECFNDRNAELSDQICTGLQLANFWQDIARDAEIGRTYLPRDVREKYCYSDADLHARCTTPEFQQMLKHLVEDARSRFHHGRPLLNQLRGRIRMDIELFVRGGLLILEEIEKIDYRVWERRPVLRKSQLIRAVMKTLCRWPVS